MATSRKKPSIKEVEEYLRLFQKFWDILGKYRDQVYTFSKEVTRKILLRLHGKQISVLGPVAAGKTTFLHVLKDPGIFIDPMNYEKTTESVPFSDGLFVKWKLPLSGESKKSETISMRIRKPKDVGGELSIRNSRDGWIDVCRGSDFVFYLFDAHLYSTKTEVADRIRTDLEWICENGQCFATGFKIVMLANKMDKVVEHLNWQDWADKEVPRITEIAFEALGPYKNHMILVMPCSLLSNRHRTNAISLALQHLAEAV